MQCVEKYEAAVERYMLAVIANESPDTIKKAHSALTKATGAIPARRRTIGRRAARTDEGDRELELLDVGRLPAAPPPTKMGRLEHLHSCARSNATKILERIKRGRGKRTHEAFRAEIRDSYIKLVEVRIRESGVARFINWLDCRPFGPCAHIGTDNTPAKIRHWLRNGFLP